MGRGPSRCHACEALSLLPLTFVRHELTLEQISAIGHSLAAGLVIRYLHEQIDRSTSYGLSALGRFTSTPKKPTVRIMDVPAVSTFTIRSFLLT